MKPSGGFKRDQIEGCLNSLARDKLTLYLNGRSVYGLTTTITPDPFLLLLLIYTPSFSLLQLGYDVALPIVHSFLIASNNILDHRLRCIAAKATHRFRQ